MSIKIPGISTPTSTAADSTAPAKQSAPAGMLGMLKETAATTSPRLSATLAKLSLKAPSARNMFKNIGTLASKKSGKSSVNVETKTYQKVEEHAVDLRQLTYRATRPMAERRPTEGVKMKTHTIRKPNQSTKPPALASIAETPNNPPALASIAEEPSKPL